jgi:hypothetical protein
LLKELDVVLELVQETVACAIRTRHAAWCALSWIGGPSSAAWASDFCRAVHCPAALAALAALAAVEMELTDVWAAHPASATHSAPAAAMARVCRCPRISR